MRCKPLAEGRDEMNVVLENKSEGLGIIVN